LAFLVKWYLEAIAYENRISYWDGKTDGGELVASGNYFYQIDAGDYLATRNLYPAI